MEFSGYCFYIDTNIYGDFQICISVPLSSFNSIIVQMSEKRVHQIESKNEWLPL